MTGTLIDNLTKDIALAAQTKLAALNDAVEFTEKDAADYRIVSTLDKLKTALGSPELKAILADAHKGGMAGGKLMGLSKGILEGAKGTYRGIKSSDPGLLNRLKGGLKGGVREGGRAAVKGFANGYTGGATSSILSDFLMGTTRAQKVKNLFKSVNSPIKNYSRGFISDDPVTLAGNSLFNINGGGAINDMDKHFLRKMYETNNPYNEIITL